MKRKLIITILIFSNSLMSEIFDGYTLFTKTLTPTSTILMTNDFQYINTWDHDAPPASMAYLLPDSTLIYPYMVENPTMVNGGVGGGIKALNWNNEVLWNYTFSNETYQHHHDIEPLPNGNILIIVWEMKTVEEAYALGRQVIDNNINQIWSSAILEFETINGNIIWEWHLWDHLIQNVDSNLPSYGVISEHPELFDINKGTIGSSGGPTGNHADWMHINSIHYNSTLDQIILSSRDQSEIYIIDHSTTTEEAASHSGGNSGKGGDFLYRWGNPSNYDRGDESYHILGNQHSASWIPNDFPGAGNIIIFNNLPGSGYYYENNTDESELSNSVIIEITPPLDANGNYILNENDPYEPSMGTWSHELENLTSVQGGVFRLLNGNTLITELGPLDNRIIEINNDGNILWEYVNIGGKIARCQKYSIDYLNNYLYGDINEDEIINVLDLVLIVNIALDNDFNILCDLNNDNIVNILDIILILNIIIY
tara:strand:- start:534 stop:1982 length:1449 start_codon:yes stop_codon:yes gene_type:complete